MNHGMLSRRGRVGPLPLTTRIKWRGFRLLERLSDLRGNAAASGLVVELPDQPVDALWVFVSTIGELNAIDPFLRKLVEHLPRLKLVLITDHPHYRDSYLARYPHAEVCVTLGHGDDARMLASHFHPRLLVVAEIPCLPSDAPCRFSVAFVLQAKRAGAPAIVVNGWLYHYAPACRMDTIERRLFARDYLRAFDVLCIQTEEAAKQLVEVGARPEAIAVTGNIKFDAMQRSDWHVDQARSPRLLASLVRSDRPIVVAGCVTNDDEQAAVLDAFGRLRETHPGALLVIAPRHPEVASRMQALKEHLSARQLPACFRSSIEDAPIDTAMACLVLDTMGDLRDFYAAATVAHVGVDHNLLEPLSFDKPVTVSTGWEDTYPSWPVYQTLMEQHVLLEATGAAELLNHWDTILSSPESAAGIVTRANQGLRQARGAVDKHFSAIGGCLGPLIDRTASPFFGPVQAPDTCCK